MGGGSQKSRSSKARLLELEEGMLGNRHVTRPWPAGWHRITSMSRLLFNVDGGLECKGKIGGKYIYGCLYSRFLMTVGFMGGISW